MRINSKSINFWDIIAWLVLFSILIWVILKITGVINTPLLLEYYPVLGAIYLAGWHMHKLESVAEDVKNLKRFKEITIQKINNIETNCKLNHSIINR